MPILIHSLFADGPQMARTNAPAGETLVRTLYEVPGSDGATSPGWCPACSAVWRRRRREPYSCKNNQSKRAHPCSASEGAQGTTFGAVTIRKAGLTRGWPCMVNLAVVVVLTCEARWSLLQQRRGLLSSSGRSLGACVRGLRCSARGAAPADQLQRLE
jgi:hypothetical protein